MGCSQSSDDGPTPEEREQHREIERGLRDDKKADAKEVKILLLGAGEAGKSTYLFFFLFLSLFFFFFFFLFFFFFIVFLCVVGVTMICVFRKSVECFRCLIGYLWFLSF